MVVRNVAAGSLSKRIGWEEGKELPHPIVEFYYKDDDLVTRSLQKNTSDYLNWLLKRKSKSLRKGLAVNEAKVLMLSKGIRLIDFKLEFGLDQKGEILLADEISPDTCRFWDIESGKILTRIVSAGIWAESLKPIGKSINASRKRLHERHFHRGPQTGHSGSTRTSRDELASGLGYDEVQGFESGNQSKSNSMEFHLMRQMLDCGKCVNQSLSIRSSRITTSR